jgi:hypothetical protein
MDFRNETKAALFENKNEHGDIKELLNEVCNDVAYIRGKLSTGKSTLRTAKT